MKKIELKVWHLAAKPLTPAQLVQASRQRNVGRKPA